MTTPDFTPVTPKQWLKSDTEIATMLHCHPRTVTRERAKRGLEKGARKPGSGRPRKAGTYDLTQTIKWNAEKLKVTPQRASQLKKEALNQDEWI